MCTKQLVQCLEHLACISYPCFIVRDLNAPTTDWANLVMLENCSDIRLLNFAIHNGFTQIVQETTRYNSILDIILNNEPNTVFDVSVCASVGCSDHYCVNFTVVLELDSLCLVPNTAYSNYQITRKCYRWRDADYNGMASTGIRYCFWQ